MKKLLLLGLLGLMCSCGPSKEEQIVLNDLKTSYPFLKGREIEILFNHRNCLPMDCDSKDKIHYDTVAFMVAMVCLFFVSIYLCNRWIDKKIHTNSETTVTHAMSNDKIIKETKHCEDAGLRAVARTYAFSINVYQVDCRPK